MTGLLREAFERASQLPEALQDDVATQLLEEIEGELRWDDTLRRSHVELEKLADRALVQKKAGKTQRKGFDEL
jgi:hypothetical protein